MGRGAVDLIVIDSVAALVPQSEIEGEMGDPRDGHPSAADEPGAAQAQRRPRPQSNTAIIFINQLRQKIGVAFGNPETTTGGNALKFYASVRLDIRNIGVVKNGERWSATTRG